MALHGARVQAAGETYMGLVEVGVGLIPAGGGTKEMTARAVERVTALSTDLLPLDPEGVRGDRLRHGRDERGRGARARLPARRSTASSMNRDRLIADAKDLALSLRARRATSAPVPRTQIAGRRRGGARRR